MFSELDRHLNNLENLHIGRKAFQNKKWKMWSNETIQMKKKSEFFLNWRTGLANIYH